MSEVGTRFRLDRRVGFEPSMAPHIQPSLIRNRLQRMSNEDSYDLNKWMPTLPSRPVILNSRKSSSTLVLLQGIQRLSPAGAPYSHFYDPTSISYFVLD